MSNKEFLKAVRTVRQMPERFRLALFGSRHFDLVLLTARQISFERSFLAITVVSAVIMSTVGLLYVPPVWSGACGFWSALSTALVFLRLIAHRDSRDPIREHTNRLALYCAEGAVFLTKCGDKNDQYLATLKAKRWLDDLAREVVLLQTPESDVDKQRSWDRALELRKRLEFLIAFFKACGLDVGKISDYFSKKS